MSRYTQAELDSMKSGDRRVLIIGGAGQGKTTLAEAINSIVPDIGIIARVDDGRTTTAALQAALELSPKGAHFVHLAQSMDDMGKAFARSTNDVGNLIENLDREAFQLAKAEAYGYEPSRPKPKHSNGRYNKVNRKKNKASRKARKQNRR